MRKKGSGLAPITNPRRRRLVVRQVCKSSGQLEAQSPLDPGAARRRWRGDAERAECGRAKPEPERGRRSRAGSGRAEMPYKLKKEKVSVALSSRLRLGACAELWERPSQARDSPRLTLPSGPRRTPRASPPPPLLAAPPACAAAGKASSPCPGWSTPRTPPSFPPFIYPRPWVTTSVQICPTPRSLPCFFSTHLPPPPVYPFGTAPRLRLHLPPAHLPLAPHCAQPLLFLHAWAWAWAGLLHRPLQPLLPPRQAP